MPLPRPAFRGPALALALGAMLFCSRGAPAAEEAAEPQDVQAQVRELIAQFDGEGMSSQVRARAAMEKVIKIGKPAVLQLVEATRHKSPWVRLWSLATLCSIGDERAIEPALRLMEDPHPTARMIAVWHGSGFAARDKRIGPAVLARMADSSKDVRKWAQRAIVERKIADAEPAMEKLLDHDSGEIRLDAFITLALLRGKEIRAMAVEVIHGGAAPKRLATAYDALQRGWADWPTAEFYLGALDHAEPLVKDAGVRGLEWLLKESAQAPDPEAKERGYKRPTREQREQLYGEIERRLPPLLKSSYAPLRAHALYLLTAGRREALLPEIEAALKDPAAIVRAYALGSLARAGAKDKRTIVPALAALDDPELEVRDRAWKALQWATDGRIGVKFDPNAPEADRRAQAEKVREACKLFID